MRMGRARQTWRDALRCRRGAAMIEYALLIGLVVIVAVASIGTFGTTLNSRYVNIVTAV